MTSTEGKSKGMTIAEGLLHSLHESLDREHPSGVNDEGGVSAGELPSMVQCSVKGGFNCYPGIPGGGCHELAVFISLTSPAYMKGRGHLNFREAIEKLIQHTQGICPDKTEEAVFITDSWDPSVIYEWRNNLKQINNQVKILEIYLLSVTDSTSSIHSLSF
jgi:hypothetical protein